MTMDNILWYQGISEIREDMLFSDGRFLENVESADEAFNILSDNTLWNNESEIGTCRDGTTGAYKIHYDRHRGVRLRFGASSIKKKYGTTALFCQRSFSSPASFKTALEEILKVAGIKINEGDLEAAIFDLRKRLYLLPALISTASIIAIIAIIAIITALK